MARRRRNSIRRHDGRKYEHLSRFKEERKGAMTVKHVIRGFVIACIVLVNGKDLRFMLTVPGTFGVPRHGD